MKRAILYALGLLLWCSCGSRKVPDVSGIEVPLSTFRFEQKLFDSTAPSLTQYLQSLQGSEPAFTSLFLNHILNADPRWPADSTAAYVNSFVTSYRPVFRDAENIFRDFRPYEKAMQEACRYVKHYFPQYQLPRQIITYIGPADGYGDALTKDAFLVGLHYHLGKDNPLYKTEIVSQIYPEYLTRRFEPSTIVINALRNLVDDLYPEKEGEQPLAGLMVEKGKRLYLLQQFLPKQPEYLLIGYTEKQLKDCYKQEAVIWEMFVKNNLLQSVDRNILKNYLDEGPKTQELGEGAPGNIGSFAGWQIVKKYMDKFPETTLPQLMAMDNEILFREAKYKP